MTLTLNCLAELKSTDQAMADADQMFIAADADFRMYVAPLFQSNGLVVAENLGPDYQRTLGAWLWF